ncbi:MAG: OmpA family protein [Deltaproteobacteria bacterium]|nr:OmpA family protein [Deltaproteobacteria bacterium]
MNKEGRPMFVSGQPGLTPEALIILKTMAGRLQTIPNKIVLEGQPDSLATISQELTNWELTTVRASATSRFLGRQGIADDRLMMVAGYYSTQPLPMINPTDPVNLSQRPRWSWTRDQPAPRLISLAAMSPTKLWSKRSWSRPCARPPPPGWESR